MEARPSIGGIIKNVHFLYKRYKITEIKDVKLDIMNAM